MLRTDLSAIHHHAFGVTNRKTRVLNLLEGISSPEKLENEW